jgi:hypothetical protein
VNPDPDPLYVLPEPDMLLIDGYHGDDVEPPRPSLRRGLAAFVVVFVAGFVTRWLVAG